MKFTDTGAVVGGVRRRSDGYLVADARVSRAGLQTYLGSEVGKPEMNAVTVYRPEAEVFAADSLRSFSARPVTNDHPAEPVTAENWRKYAVGNTGEEVARDGQTVRVPLMVADAAAIADVESGKRELSVGYTCTLDWTPGVTSDGVKYDAVQTNIRANHVAIVARGRAGNQCRIGDGAQQWGVAPIQPDTTKGKSMTDTLRRVMVDGLSVQTTEQGAEAISKLLTNITDRDSKITSQAADQASAIADKDRQIGELKAEVQKLKDAAPKPGDLDRMAADRAALITSAKAVVADLDPAGKSDAEIRLAVVKARMGDAVSGASEAEVTGMFRVITADAGKKSDPVAGAIASRQTNDNTSGDNGYADRVKHMQDAWKGSGKGKE